MFCSALGGRCKRCPARAVRSRASVVSRQRCHCAPAPPTHPSSHPPICSLPVTPGMTTEILLGFRAVTTALGCPFCSQICRREGVPVRGRSAGVQRAGAGAAGCTWRHGSASHYGPRRVRPVFRTPRCLWPAIARLPLTSNISFACSCKDSVETGTPPGFSTHAYLQWGTW